MKKFLLFFTFIISIISSESWSAENLLENDQILQGRYLIKNTEFNEFLFIDDSGSNPTKIVQTSPGIFSKSIFTFEKNNEGYLIRSIDYGSYLYVSDTLITAGKDKAVKSTNNNTATRYFNIFHENEGYKFKGDNKYVKVSSKDTINGNRSVKMNSEMGVSSYFTIILYDRNYFQ